MSVIARFSVPATAFPLGEVLEVRRGIQVRLESVIPTSGTVAPYFWATGRDSEAVVAALEDSPLVEDVRVADEIDSWALFRVDWSPEVDGLLDAVADADAAILEGTGTGDSWTFRARFHGHAELSAFYRACVDEGIQIDLEAVHSPIGDGDGGAGVTDGQREALSTALAAGYFAVPRETTLVELAERLGVSDTAVSQRIRRGLTTLLSARLRPRSAAVDEPGRRD